MPTQLEQFNTQLAGLTPQELAAYTSKNPTVGVGGQTLQYNQQAGAYQPLKIVSSSSVSDANNRQNALVNAGTSAAGTTPTTPTTTPADTQLANILNTIGTNLKETTKGIQESGQQQLSAAQLSYDAQLASNNQTYGSAIRQIQNQAENARQVAVSNAVALNPYSQSKGAQTSANFQTAINAKYQELENDIRNKAVAADQLARAGYAKEAAQIQSGINSSIAQVNSQINTALYQFASLSQNQQQFRTTENRLASTAAQNDFMDYVTNFSGSPELMGDVNSYLSSGGKTVGKGLAPFIEKGMQTGLSPDEVISVLQYQTEKARNQSALESYRTQQLINSQDKQTNAQLRIAASNAVSSMSSSLISKGIMPGTIEYATNIAQATGNSSAFLPAASVDRYSNIGILSSQLTGLKERINKIDTTSSLWQMVMSHTGASAQSLSNSDLAILNGQIQALSGIIGKSVFGESGNLSNTDIQRVLNALPSGATTSQVRDALYQNIVGLLASKAIQTLQSDANNAYNVATYAPVVQDIYNKAQSVMTKNDTTKGGKSYTDPVTGKVYTY